MPSSQSRARWLVAAVALTAAVTGGIAYAAIPDVGGVIHSCYTKSSGAWRVIDADAAQACKSNEAALDLYSKGGASDKLDGQDSSAFLGASATAANSARLGGFTPGNYVLGGGVQVLDAG